MASCNKACKPRTATQGQSTSGKVQTKPQKGVPGASGGKVSLKPRTATQGQR